MINLTVHHDNKISECTIEKGTTLLRALQSNGFNIYTPCGGNGKCGKCKVWIKEEGHVTACLFVVTQPLDVKIPDAVETSVLTSQYTNTISLPLEPGPAANLSAYPMGVAIDIGTSTMALYLVNLRTGSLIETRSLINPQSSYGADVISRINYAIQHEDGLEAMHSDLVNCINEELKNFALALGIDSSDIVKISITGNTTMLHLFWKENPSSLAFIPFKPVFIDERKKPAKDIGLKCHPEAEVKTLPSISAYVGSDLVAGLASLSPQENIQRYLFIDVGTNGEMALIANDKVYCCATAAGPAFEGANISCGIPAVEGAISSFQTEGFTTIGSKKPSGICGSGLIDVVAFLRNSGKIDKDGNMNDAFEIVNASKTASGDTLTLVQQDIRELQLAKSAIASGIEILLKHAGLEANELDALYLAGGFGNFIHVESAVTIGLIPSELKDKTIAVGNASGTGAMLDLKAAEFQNMTKRMVTRAKYIELSEDEDFVTAFAMNMAFPQPSIWD